MRVLVACEFSGIVRDAFAAQEHEAWSVDLLDCEKGVESGLHYTGDALDVIRHGLGAPWDLIIAHPPCTFLTNSGARWLWRNDEEKLQKVLKRWRAMRQAAKFFNSILDSDCPRICVENPIMHKHARALIKKPYAQIIQPWQFGHGETKATCLWLKGLPLLVPTKIVGGRLGRVHLASPGPDRWKERSRTLQGIADAMADQWGAR